MGDFHAWLLRIENAWINGLRRLYNSLVSPLAGKGNYNYIPFERQINLRRVLSLLCRVHGHQLFVDGLFNADPHPGNVLLLDDGRLGLIDFGQVGAIGEKERIGMAKLHNALYRRKNDEVYGILTEEMGYRFKHASKEVWRYAAYYHDRDTEDVTQGLSMIDFMDWYILCPFRGRE